VKIDYIGFAAIALGLATLQFVLDKGQRDDWFESPYIRVFSVISLTCLAFTLIWEWRVKDPIVELRLFKDRTFLMGNVMLFTVGFALYSSTVLLPEYCQELMGYTAKQAGMVISPGGIAIMLLMPLIGYIVSRYDARKIIAFGFFVVGISLFNMMRFNLQVDFGTMMWARVLQGAGVAFLFVPINTAAYANVPREKSNAASGLINLSRNIGGSVGISFVTTMLARRTQFHQVALSEHMNPYNPHFVATWHNLANGFAASGMDAVTASKQAIAVFGLILSQQASLLAFIDNFWLLGLSMFLLVPLTFLMKKAKPGGPIAVH
jgi:DHA2 family multidrug resistance protein